MSRIAKILWVLMSGYLYISPVFAEGDQAHSIPLLAIFKSCTSFQDILNNSEHIHPNVRDFYEKLDNKPVWFDQNRLSNLGKIAIDVLQHADDEGLNPEDYRDAIDIPGSPLKWEEAEILLTTRFLEFIDDVRIGRIDPMKVSSDIKFHNSKTHAVELLLNAIQDKNSNGNKLRHMAPCLPQYAELKRILAEYRSQAKGMTHWPRLTISKTLRLGDKDPEVETLRQLLFLHGYLSNDQEFGEKYDTDVAEALKEFQKRFSLEPDGSVGAKTREVLNYPIQELIKRIIVNMERLRWLPDDLGHKHIIINVAGYVLHGFEDSEATIMMPVIVGRPDRRTPLFYAKMKNVVLNPSWGVPHSIFVNDKLPKILRDRKYIQRAKFTITDSKGRIIDPDAADWANEGKNYYLRQSPGKHNALGQIKFNIENPYTIYMHGTPEQNLFSKKARAFSSGCIRLKHPLKLAEWVLNHNEQWSCSNIQNVINKGDTQTVTLDEYIPVYFTYQTVWVKENTKGKRIFFSNDPYHLDAIMIKMLNVRA